MINIQKNKNTLVILNLEDQLGLLYQFKSIILVKKIVVSLINLIRF
jgi:hypothetical protein